VTIATRLAEAAATHPAAVFLRTSEGELTYAEVDRAAGRLATGLARAGARPGEPVIVFMNNSLDQIVTWFALSRLGAVHVPINTALIGTSLIHTFQVTQPRLAVVDRDLLPAVLAVRAHLAPQPRLVVRGPRAAGGDDGGGGDLIDFDELRAQAGTAPVATPELDPATVLFTSGTTGPSKGCTLSHRYLIRQAELHTANLGLTAADVLYSPFPLFHVDAATLTVVAALVVGGTAAPGTRLHAPRFLDEVRGFDATVFNFLGATSTILWKQPPTDRDRDHRVRLAWGVPMPAWSEGWRRRFGFPLYELYGLTDAGISAYDRIDVPRHTGSCGRVIDQFELTIVDEHDQAVPIGSDGEITVRGREPGLVMNGYWAMPDETAHAFRGGRFHTGDRGRLDTAGRLYFLGRTHDGIRRRGENISAYELEQIVMEHPEIVEVAALGVPSELTEDDVKICVVLRAGSRLRPEQILEHCAQNAPAYMVPRYIEVRSRLPKTPTHKVEKFKLRDRTDATWDSVGGGTGLPPPTWVSG
jgi:carnitine-CoA ligase